MVGFEPRPNEVKVGIKSSKKYNKSFKLNYVILEFPNTVIKPFMCRLLTQEESCSY